MAVTILTNNVETLNRECIEVHHWQGIQRGFGCETSIRLSLPFYFHMAQGIHVGLGFDTRPPWCGSTRFGCNTSPTDQPTCYRETNCSDLLFSSDISLNSYANVSSSHYDCSCIEAMTMTFNLDKDENFTCLGMLIEMIM